MMMHQFVAQTLLPVNPSTIYRVFSTGMDSNCGCPKCCPGVSIFLPGNEFALPNELVGVYERKEYWDFVCQVNKTFGETHWPSFPCIFAHFCLPFSPFCASSYCESERTKKLQEVIRIENSRIMARGIYWEVLGRTPAFAFSLIVLAHERGLYEKNAPQNEKRLIVNGSLVTNATTTQPLQTLLKSVMASAPTSYTAQTSTAPPSYTPSNDSQSRFCTKCGNQVSSSFTFCGKCGTQIT